MRFELAHYDASKPLIIDPVLVYSTYLGGSGDDNGVSLAVDSFGNAYVTGWTNSPNFPIANAFQAAYGGGTCGIAPNTYPCPDTFVTKLNAAGSALVYSTYLGGNSAERGSAIVVDSSGNAYVAGNTWSTDFPTANAFQAAYGGGTCGIPLNTLPCYDAFVTKLDATGSALVYSTYLGGAGEDFGNDIALDSFGNAYVAGPTNSLNFPTANAFQPAFGGGTCGTAPDTYPCWDAFVTKLNAAGSALVYSTYLGGRGVDGGTGIAVDSFGNAYVTGWTDSTDFPRAANPFQPAFGGGGIDAFVTKISPAELGVDLTGSWASGLHSWVTTRCTRRFFGSCVESVITGFFDVQNLGTEPAPSSNVLFFLSGDTTLGGDIFVTGLPVGPLLAGETRRMRFSRSVSGPATSKFLIAFVDADNAVAEANENNNVIVYGPLP